MKNKGKIGILCYSLFAGGAERNAINIALYFQKKGVSYDLILFKDINEYKDEYGDILKTLSIYSILHLKKTIFPIFKPFYYIYFFILLTLFIKKRGYSVLVGSVEYDPFYLTALIAKIFNLKSVLIVGNNISEELLRLNIILRKIFYQLFKWSFINSSKIVCVSHGLRRTIVTFFKVDPNHVVTVYNGVNLPLINEQLKKQIHTATDRIARKNIVFMGRLVKKKGVSHLINSFSIVSKVLPQYNLVIIGKGPQENLLKKQVNQLNLSKKVSFSGFIKVNPYIYMKRASIFVFSSLYEGFGNVLIEAMVCGLPIISTNCPHGPTEILGPSLLKRDGVNYAKWGVITPYIKYSDSKNSVKTKEQVMAKAIIHMLQNKKDYQYYQKMSRVRASFFSSDKMARQLLAEINKVGNVQIKR